MGTNTSTPGQCQPLELQDTATAPSADSPDAAAAPQATEVNQAAEPPAPRSKKQPSTRNMLVMKLGPVYPRLRAQAKRQHTTMVGLIRQGLQHVLDDEPQPDGPRVEFEPFQHSPDNVQFHLLLPPKYADAMTTRARDANMTRGEFVWSLLNGISPPPLARDHAEALRALRDSTDRLAVLSTDLSMFLRLLTQATTDNPDLEPHRASIMSLSKDVRRHLKAASLLIDELRPHRKQRR